MVPFTAFWGQMSLLRRVNSAIIDFILEMILTLQDEALITDALLTSETPKPVEKQAGSDIYATETFSLTAALYITDLF